MLHIALYQPEIPPNTGNIIRLCANTGFTLHLIRPLGFPFGHKQLKRAGMDYSQQAQVVFHEAFEAFDQWCVQTGKQQRLFAFTTKAQRCYSEVKYQQEDVLLFGPETRGLPTDMLEALPDDQLIRIAMRSGSRSLNLSNSVAIASFEAWRQLNFQ